MWKPFDERFQNILQKIAIHQKIVKEELQLANIQGLRFIIDQEFVHQTSAQVELQHLVEEMDEKFGHHAQCMSDFPV